MPALRTPKVTDRLNRASPHIARLDRQIRLHGEPIEIQSNVGASNTISVRMNCRGIVRTLTQAQLIGGISTQNYLVILSPTDIRRAKWPGSQGADIVSTGFKQIGHRPSRDFNMPTTSHVLFFRGVQATITGRALVYDKGEVVRIELKVAGF
jgi:hypothetical protein